MGHFSTKRRCQLKKERSNLEWRNCFIGIGTSSAEEIPYLHFHNTIIFSSGEDDENFKFIPFWSIFLTVSD